MYFLIEDDELLQKNNNTWNKVSISIIKEFDSEPTYNEQFLKTKIKCYSDEATDFYDKEMPRL